MESRHTIPFPVLAGRGPIDRGDGITVALDQSGYEAVYRINGEKAAVAYVSAEGMPLVNIEQRHRQGEPEIRRLIAVLVMAWAHAHELSTLWHIGGPPHAG